jgi:hypothetical protein
MPWPRLLLKFIEKLPAFILGPISILNSQEECLKYKRLLDPLIAESETVTKDKQSFKDVLEIHSKWTNSTLEILEIFDDIDDENMSLASDFDPGTFAGELVFDIETSATTAFAERSAPGAFSHDEHLQAE